MPRPPAAAVLLTLAVLAGCGAGSDPSTVSKATKSATPSGSLSQGPVASAGQPGAAAGTKPVVDKPTGPAPTNLVVTDITKGSGPAAAPGRTLTVQYVGVSYSTGTQFDASWDRGQPFSFPLGAGMVIPGWDQGLVGMAVGGRRKLVVPPQLAYGDRGAGGVIGPHETLVFVIDLLQVS